MKGDFSRLTFDPARGFTQVLRQQGRVDVDADWNEQQAILTHLDRTTRRDVIGPAGAPVEGGGFAVSVAGGAPALDPGRIYVRGRLVELGAETALAVQPWLAGLSAFLDETGAPIAVPTEGRYLVYLEVWDRHVTAVEDESLREPALGGPDTTTRVGTVWRARALRVGAAGGDAHCETVTPAWTALVTPPDGRLAAQAQPTGGAASLCALPETAGYQSLDHRLYRVEIHDPGLDGAATFKWSRDNAAFVALWTARSGNELTVSTTCQDSHVGFRNAGWVELTSEAFELSRRPGTMVRVNRVIGDVLEIDPATATGTLDPAAFGAMPKVRAWDGAAPQSVVAGSFIPLENGVEVEFSAGAYRTGDHWTIPARSGFGVLWPSVGAVPTPLPRAGTGEAFARLGLLDFVGGAWSLVADCRPLFPAATVLETLDALSGDGQEATPDPADTTASLPLPRPLRVGVARGRHPVANAPVRFRVLSGGGTLAGGVTEAIVATDPDGVAEIAFALDSTTLEQRVEARLLSPGGDPRHLAHEFAARLSRAAEVSFDPAACPPLAGDRTVQSAIERLCQIGARGCATYVVSPEGDWRAVLAALQPGEDAHVCFQRGEYRTAERIELTGLGHIILSGCGEGSRIVAEGRESALHFIDCASLKVVDLAFLAPDESDSQAPIPDINGVLTATRCGAVDVEGALFLTAAAQRRDRACLTVRQTEGGRAETVTAQVRVSNCEFRIGDGQTGVLVTDAGVVRVAENRFAGFGLIHGGGNWSDDGDLTTLPGPTVDAILGRLVRDVTFGTVGGEDGAVTVEAGAFRAEFESSVNPADWREAVRANRPSAEELADETAFEGYVHRLAGEFAAEPTRAPSFNALVNAIELASGSRALEETTANRLLLGERGIRVRRATRAATGRGVTVTSGAVRMSFDSEFSQANWTQLLRAIGGGAAASNEALEQRVREAARALLADSGLRQRFAFARAWIADLRWFVAAVAGQGVVCAGSRLDRVTVSGNIMERMHEGVRVAVSHAAGPDDPPDIVGGVEVIANRLTLALPFSETRVDQGVMIGNVARATLVGNEVLYTPAPNQQPAAVGIEMWGHFGPQIHLRENTVSNAAQAIRVTAESAPPDPDRPAMWRAVANLGINADVERAFEFRTDPGGPSGGGALPFIARDNLVVRR